MMKKNEPRCGLKNNPLSHTLDSNGGRTMEIYNLKRERCITSYLKTNLTVNGSC